MAQRAVIRDPFTDRVAIVDSDEALIVIVAPPGADATDLTQWRASNASDPRAIGW